MEKLKTIQLRGKRKDNKPYFKVYLDLEKIIKDRTLWKTVSEIEEKISVFEKLRKAMRIAATSGRHGLNDEGQKGNILEQFFRSLKRANRRRTGNASSSRMLRTILAETPLVRNLENPSYMRILLSGKASLEEVFAEVDIDTFRDAFRGAQDVSEKIPSKLKPLIAMPDFPERLLSMAEKAAVRPKSNRILQQ